MEPLYQSNCAPPLIDFPVFRTRGNHIGFRVEHEHGYRGPTGGRNSLDSAAPQGHKVAAPTIKTRIKDSLRRSIKGVAPNVAFVLTQVARRACPGEVAFVICGRIPTIECMLRPHMFHMEGSHRSNCQSLPNAAVFASPLSTLPYILAFRPANPSHLARSYPIRARFTGWR